MPSAISFSKAKRGYPAGPFIVSNEVVLALLVEARIRLMLPGMHMHRGARAHNFDRLHVEGEEAQCLIFSGR